MDIMKEWEQKTLERAKKDFRRMTKNMIKKDELDRWADGIGITLVSFAKHYASPFKESEVVLYSKIYLYCHNYFKNVHNSKNKLDSKENPQT